MRLILFFWVFSYCSCFAEGVPTGKEKIFELVRICGGETDISFRNSFIDKRFDFDDLDSVWKHSGQPRKIVRIWAISDYVQKQTIAFFDGKKWKFKARDKKIEQEGVIEGLERSQKMEKELQKLFRNPVLFSRGKGVFSSNGMDYVIEMIGEKGEYRWMVRNYDKLTEEEFSPTVDFIEKIEAALEIKSSAE